MSEDLLVSLALVASGATLVLPHWWLERQRRGAWRGLARWYRSECVPGLRRILGDALRGWSRATDALDRCPIRNEWQLLGHIAWVLETGRLAYLNGMSDEATGELGRNATVEAHHCAEHAAGERGGR